MCLIPCHRLGSWSPARDMGWACGWEEVMLTDVWSTRMEMGKEMQEMVGKKTAAPERVRDAKRATDKVL